MSGFPYLLLLLIVPFVGALTVAGMSGAPVRTTKITALVFSLVEFALAIGLWFDYRAFLDSNPTDPFVETLHVSWIGSFNISFALGTDGIALVLLAMTAFLVPIVIGAGWHEKLPRGRTIGGYFSLLLLFETAMMGLFAAADVFLFYCFFELMLVPMYFLIGYFGGPRRAYAATKFFLYSFLGGLIMLAGVIGLYVASGDVPGRSDGTLNWEELRAIAGQIPESTQTWIFLGFAVAFAIKAPLVPLHTWLPDAGGEAPTGSSTLLVTVMDKVGTFGFLRICLPLLPAASHRLVWLFLILSMLGIIYAAIVAAMQTDLKKFVTFTSIAHFGFIAMGVFAFTTQAMTGAVLYMLNHGIATGLLFVIIGMLISRGGSRQISDYGGVWKIAPMLAGVFLVATMATLALPGTNSFVSEFLVLIGTFKRYPIWAVIGTVGIILSATYVLWIFQRTMTGPVRGAAVVGGATRSNGDSPADQSAGRYDASAVDSSAADSEGSTASAASADVPGAAVETGSADVSATAVAVMEPEPEVEHETESEARSRAKFGDLTLREIVVVTPLIAAVLFLGVYPKPVLNVIQPSVNATMSWVGATDPAPSIGTVNGGGN